jgi:hypothetical protein
MGIIFGETAEEAGDEASCRPSRSNLLYHEATQPVPVEAATTAILAHQSQVAQNPISACDLRIRSRASGHLRIDSRHRQFITSRSQNNSDS